MYRVLCYLTALFSFIVSLGFSQPSTLDSLKAVVANEGLPDTTRNLAKSDWAYEIRRNTSDSTRLFIEATFAEAKALNYIPGQARSLSALGGYLWRIGSLEEAGTVLHRAEPLAIQAKDSLALARTWVDLGTVFLASGEFEQALDQYEQAEQLCITIDETSMLAAVYNNIAETYGSLEDFAAADAYYQKAVLVAQQANDTFMVGFLYINLGDISTEQRLYQAALQYYALGRAVGDDLSSPLLVARAIIGKGKALVGLELPQQAIVALDSGLSYNKEFRYYDGMITGEIALGQAYRQLGQFSEAIAHGLSSVSQAKSYRMDYYAQALLAISQTYADVGNFERAFETTQIYQAITDSIGRDRVLKRVDYLQQQKAKEEAHAAREAENATALARDLSSQKRQSLLVSGSLILLVVVLGLVALVGRLRQSNQHRLEENEALQALNQEIQAQNEEILQQRDQLQITYEDVERLSQLGKIITATLTVEALVETLYQELGQLLEVSQLGIGLYQPAQEALYFSSFYENGEWNKDILVPLDNKGSLAVPCFVNQEVIKVGNVERDLPQYTESKPEAVGKPYATSILYVPITHQEHRMGVLTIQSNRPYAYMGYQVSIVQNLAVYIAIALANAQTLQRLSAKNESVEQSISYAERIQHTLMASAVQQASLLPEHFIFHRARDIVSGDFYWVREHQGYIYLGVADCTGHGVPGALMSVICSQALNEALQGGSAEPGPLLDATRDLVVQRLAQSDVGMADGMDITLCRFQFDNGELTWSGANLPLVLINPNRSEVPEGARALPNAAGAFEFKADRQPIGATIRPRPFTTR
ncbi:MAG TPA: hypothetical protein DCR93_34710, partial [Cytophagales bacterium]|nr:hypothetical protein [Cytophagales bacterium]